MSPGPAHAATSGQTALEHATRYEALRGYAMQRDSPATRDGLFVLLSQGVAAWMDAWRMLPAAPTRPTQGDCQRPSLLPEGASAEVVRVLAAMTLGHIQQVHA